MNEIKLVVKRVEEERDELKKRVDALAKTVGMLEKNISISEMHKQLLGKQLVYMSLYLNMLELRLKLFKEEAE